MKLKDGFILREVAGQVIILSVSSEFDMNKVITVNETGKFLWKQLEKETTKEELVSELLKEYDVDESIAFESVGRFISKLEELGVLVK